MNCPSCEANDIKVAFLKGEYRILKCKNCEHLFTDVIVDFDKAKEIYSDKYFFDGGAGYDDYFLEKEMLIKRGEYYSKKMSQFMKTGKVLDVGAAAGFILKGFENTGWKGTGIEPNETMSEYGKNILGLNINPGTIETVELPDRFDLAILIQVAGHIYNPISSLKKIHGLLNPGGHVLIETWNKDSLTAKISGKHWHEFSPPSTLNYFSKKSINELMSRQGFSLLKQGHPKKKIHSQHAKSLIKHKLQGSKSLRWLAGFTVLIPGNMMIPYPAEDLFWAVYKKM
ncbi:MAG: class I SAM-dependent methyltransferase [Ginsengibacter sp.]